MEPLLCLGLFICSCMNWIDKLQKRFGGLAVPNLALYMVAGQVIIFGMEAAGRLDISKLYLNPLLVLNGEVWRVVSFMFIPFERGGGSIIFLLFAWYIFWMTSQALEAQWGTFKYNLYIWCSLIFTVLGSLLFPQYYYENRYLYITVLFAFATLYPNFEFLLFFVLPVKVKWIAWIGAGFIALQFLNSPWSVRMMIFAGLANYALFFGRDLYQAMYYRQRRMEHQKKAQVAAEEAFHTCGTCGATDKSNPERTFRYVEGQGICNVCQNKTAEGES